VSLFDFFYRVHWVYGIGGVLKTCEDLTANLGLHLRRNRRIGKPAAYFCTRYITTTVCFCSGKAVFKKLIFFIL
jgi:hypothetical protein